MDANENLEKVRKAMAAHSQVQLAGELKNSIAIDFTSLEGNRYTGVVVVKKPNIGDFMRIGAVKADILKKFGVTDPKLVDDSVVFMAHVMATLSVVAVKRPEWLLKIEEVQEPEVVIHVFDMYEGWERSFRKPIQGATTTDRETSEGADTMAASEDIREHTADGPEDSSDDGRADRAGDSASDA